MCRKYVPRKLAHFRQSANVYPSDENATAFSYRPPGWGRGFRGVQR